MRGWWPLRPLIWALRPKSPGEFVRGWWPLRPTMQALRPKPRVTFVSRRKSPKACQNLRFWTPSRFQQNFGNLTQSGSRDGTLALSDWKPQPSLSALFALAYASRRATFYHQLRPICHFEMSGRIGLFFSFGFCGVTPSGFRPWRGRLLDADNRSGR